MIDFTPFSIIEGSILCTLMIGSTVYTGVGAIMESLQVTWTGIIALFVTIMVMHVVQVLRSD